MCGYIAIFKTTPSKFDIQRVNNAVHVLDHRGPDENSIWVDPNGYAIFGYVRLSLVGISNGTQPIFSPDGNVAIMVNGEFYEHDIIRKELEKKGCIFRTSSDSEIALYLYLLYGVDGLHQLRGEFSFVIFDRKKNIFFAMRDRLGVKPLYYSYYNNSWYFASEIKGIIEAGVPAEWDTESYLTRGFILQNRTLFKNICALEPGHWMIINDGNAKFRKYWDFEFESDQIMTSMKEEEIIESVRREIEDAVQVRLQADVPVGVSISGGLDSSSVLGVATAILGKSLDTFHLSFPEDPAYDELEFAKIATKHNNANMHVIEVTSNSIADNFSDAIWHTETPFFNAHSVAKLILCKAIGNSGTRAVLSGEGADEIFGGYPHFRRDMVLYDNESLSADVKERLLNQINTFEEINELSEDMMWVKGAMSHGVSWLETQARLLHPLDSIYKDEYSLLSKNMEGYKQFYNQLDHNKIRNISPVHRSMYMLAKTCLPNIVLNTLGDRIEMAGSIEGRPPLIDHKVIELVSRIPIGLKMKGGTVKYVLREAMKPFLPEEIYNRKKQYFRAPPTSLKTNNCKLFELMNDELMSDSINNIPFIDANKVRRMVADLNKYSESERVKMDYVLTELTGLCIMQKKFKLS